jgi:hypothetical protein
MPSRFDSTSARRVTLGGESRVVRVFVAHHDPRRDEVAPPTPPREDDAEADEIDVASDDSFPASDPPSFTSSHV